VGLGALDVVILAVGVAGIAMEVLVDPYLANSSLPAFGKAVQIGYVVAHTG